MTGRGQSPPYDPYLVFGQGDALALVAPGAGRTTSQAVGIPALRAGSQGAWLLGTAALEQRSLGVTPGREAGSVQHWQACTTPRASSCPGGARAGPGAPATCCPARHSPGLPSSASKQNGRRGPGGPSPTTLPWPPWRPKTRVLELSTEAAPPSRGMTPGGPPGSASSGLDGRQGVAEVKGIWLHTLGLQEEPVPGEGAG